MPQTANSWKPSKVSLIPFRIVTSSMLMLSPSFTKSNKCVTMYYIPVPERFPY
jgi:hypothetical protein